MTLADKKETGCECETSYEAISSYDGFKHFSDDYVEWLENQILSQQKDTAVKLHDNISTGICQHGVDFGKSCSGCNR